MSVGITCNDHLRSFMWGFYAANGCYLMHKFSQKRVDVNEFNNDLQFPLC